MNATGVEAATPRPKPEAPTAGTRSMFADLLKGTAVYGLGMIAQRLMSFVLLPLYTRYLSRADYGILDLLDVLTAVAGLLLAVRLGPSLYYYYHHAEDEEQRGRYVTTAFFGCLLVGLAAGAAGLLLAAPISQVLFQSPRYAGFVEINFVGFALEPAIAVGFCYLRVRNHAVTFVKATMMRLSINVALNVFFLVGLGMGPSSLLWSRVASSAALVIFLGWSILSAHRPTFGGPAFRQMALYSLPLGVGAVAEFLLNCGDRLFLKQAVSLSELGLYALAYRLGQVITFAYYPFFTYWNAQIVGLMRRPQGEAFYTRMATYLLLGLAMVLLGLTVFIDPLLTIMAPTFRGAAAMVPCLALAQLVRGMGMYFSNTFLLVKRPDCVARNSWLGAGACLLAYALLIPRYHLWGAVAATMLGYGIMAASAFRSSQRLRPIRFEYGRWAKIAASTVAAALPPLLLRPSGFWAQVALGAACLGLFGILLGATGFVTREERRAAARYLRKLRSVGAGSRADVVEGR